MVSQAANPVLLRHRSIRAVASCLGLASLAWTWLGCASPSSLNPSEPLSGAVHRRPISFSFPTVDGKPITSESIHGRATVLVFLTTFDLASQVVARRVGEVAQSFRPRCNAVAIALEPPDHSPLVTAYAATLDLPYPIAMASHPMLEGRGSFSDIHHVPTIVFLNRRGAEVSRRQGEISLPEIAAELENAIRTP